MQSKHPQTATADLSFWRDIVPSTVLGCAFALAIILSIPGAGVMFDGNGARAAFLQVRSFMNAEMSFAVEQVSHPVSD